MTFNLIVNHSLTVFVFNLKYGISWDHFELDKVQNAYVTLCNIILDTKLDYYAHFKGNTPLKQEYYDLWQILLDHYDPLIICQMMGNTDLFLLAYNEMRNFEIGF